MQKTLIDIYTQLYNMYGPQGWWPIVGYDGSNPTKTGAVNGYHVGDYSFPRTRDEQFEICLGCFLTQNTSWVSVERSLRNLSALHALTPEVIMTLNENVFKEAIRPSGYNNQKARYIKAFIPFYFELQDRVPTRDALLSCVGIGPETADSMLLYAFKQQKFVVDAYTKRILMHLDIVGEKDTYDTIKKICEDGLKKENENVMDQVIIYQEFHALLVEHAKRYYSKKPYGNACWLYARYNK